MDFFKSVFSEDPEPSTDPDSEKVEQHPTTATQEQEALLDESPKSSTPTSTTSIWSFGGIMKTFASTSESVLQTYKKDLEEFSSGLKKETAVIRQVASRAVKDLPTSLEVGASVAQESLESVGQAIDDLGSSVWRGTAEIITHGKDVLLSVDEESDSSESQGFSNASIDSRRYSRYESLIRTIQVDSATYSDEPEDLDEYEKWKSGFVLGEKDEEIDVLLNENGAMDSVYRKLVPTTISDETFWSRYFYKVYKVKQVEEARAILVKRAISGDDDEDLSWDVDDEDEEDKGETSVNTQTEKKAIEEPLVEDSKGDVKLEEKNVDSEIEEKEDEDGVNNEELLAKNPEQSELNEININENPEEKMVSDGKNEQAESCKDSDVSVVSSQPSLPEEQDLSWDEIEDLSGIDEKKASASNSPNKADLRKRLSAADEEEDLSWDTEDDD